MSSLSPNLRGIIFMVLSTGTFVINDTFLKLAVEGLPPFQTLFMRGISAALWCLPLVIFTGNLRKMPQALDRWVCCAIPRGSRVLCFISALPHLPLADITAINQTADDVLVGVAIIYGDRIGWSGGG